MSTGCGEKRIHTLLADYKPEQPIWETVKVPCKTRNRTLSCPENHYWACIQRKWTQYIEEISWHAYSCSTVCNNPDTEPADEWIKKTVHRYCGIVFTHTKEWGAVSCSSRGEQKWPFLTPMWREFSQETK